MQKQLAIESGSSFEREKIPPPHASNPDGSGLHCKTVKAVPVCFLDCQCGYSGLAHVQEGKPICPAHLARVAAHQRADKSTLETAAIAPNIQQLIDAAVSKALAATKGGN